MQPMFAFAEPAKRRCSVCHDTKLLGEFYPDKRKPDGASYVCRDCGRKASLARGDAKRGGPTIRRMLPAVEASNKRCSECLEVKPLAEFYSHKTTADGASGACRDCTKARTLRNSDAKRGGPTVRRMPPPGQGNKRCNTCREVKPVAEFYPRKRGDLTASCRVCTKAQTKASRERVKVQPKIALPPDAVKRCDYCKQTMLVSGFPRNQGQPDGLARICKPCNNAKTRAWGAANPIRMRNRQLIGLYGITLTERDAMIAAQGGRCAICKRIPDPLPKKAGGLHVDHCHAKGDVRGMLCSDCNRGLGCFADNPEYLMSAARYLTGGSNS